MLIDMGQATQTVGNALKPYGLVYELVTNERVPVQWAIDPAKSSFRLDSGNPIPYDFTATTTSGVKSYAGGSFVIDASLVTPSVLADVAQWRAQGVVVDELAAPLTTEIYGTITSFPKAVLDLQNGKIALPYYANAGIPATSYRLGDPSNLTECDDIYIMPHADPAYWTDAWKQSLYNFVVDGGGLWAGCHAVSSLEALTTYTSSGTTTKLNFLSTDLVPYTSHGSGVVPYDYNTATADDPVMQIMNRMDAALQSGSEKIYVPTAAQWRSTTTVAVYDADQPNNPAGGTSPYNKAAALVYGNAYGDPNAGLVMYEGGHSFAGTTAANVAAQRAFFNFLLLNGIGKAPRITATPPTVVPGQISTITASIAGGSGTFTYQWVSTSGSVFSNPAGTWKVGDPPITTQYQMNGSEDTVKLLVTDSPCGRQSVWYQSLTVSPPTLDLDGNDSTGATGADYQGYFDGNSTVVPAADLDTAITAGGTTIQSAVLKLITRPDGLAETLLIDEALAATYGISVTSDGKGGYELSGSATLAQYQAVIATLQYVNSLGYPTPTDRVIEVTVNDGSTDSNTATSVLSYAGGYPATATKQLYLSDPGQGLDRVDPVASADSTTSSVSFNPTTASDSTGMAMWSNSANKNLEYRPWNLTAYGSQSTATVDGGSYNTMAWASSATRNEAVVVGVTTDRQVSGSVWNGTKWTPIKLSIGGKSVSKLGAPSQSQWWGAAVAYQTGNGNAMLVWNSGSKLYYSQWDGSTWAAATVVQGYTGTEPRQIRLAANPTAGSNEMVVVVTDKNEVDRALVWNGTTWGNQVQFDNNTGHNFTDLAVVYERQSGKAMVTYASGTSGAVGYQIWNGTTWSSAATVAVPSSGTNGYAQWTVLASAPGSNRIVLGVETSGKDSWMSVWNGTSWATSTLGVTDGVAANNNLNIAVAFESSSGEAIAIYQNDLTSTELQYKTWAPGTGTWSTGTNFGDFSTKSSASMIVNPNPFSDQVMLLVNDGGKVLRSMLWSGSSFAAPVQLESNTNTITGQPMAFRWDRNIPGVVTAVQTFTQTLPLTSRLVLPAGGAVKVISYIQVTSGTLPATPKLATRVGYDGTPLVSLQDAPTVTNLGSGKYKLEWNATMTDTVSVPSGSSLALSLAAYESGYSFDLLYDSATYPSQLQVATSTPIAITTKGVFADAFPATTTAAGTATAGKPVYVRFTVTDPFGAADITGATVVIKDGAAAQVASLTLTDANVVASTPGSKTYEVAWTPMSEDTFSMVITSMEGTEGVTATADLELPVDASPDLTVSKTDNGAGVNAGGVVPYTISYSNVGLAPATGVVLTETLPKGATFDAAASSAGWTAIGPGQYVYPVGTVNPGDSGTATFAVKVNATVAADLEQLLNTVSIADDGSHGPDANPDNNDGEDTTPVTAAPDLVITKSDGGTSTVAGGVVLYRIDFSNVGNQDAIGVVITEQLPANTTFNGTYSFGDWDTEGTGFYTFAVGSLPAGASGFVTFAVNVASPLPGGTTSIANSVSIADSGTGGPDADPSNNSSSDTTPISADPQADLRVTKTDNVAQVHPGDTVTYTIVVSNAGVSAANGVAFSDHAPAALEGVTFTSVVAGGAATSLAFGTGNSIQALLDLPVGGTVTFTVTGTLARGATGRLTNAATALPPAGIVDPNTGDNTAIDDDEIVPISDLSLAKTYTYTDKDGSKSLTEGDEIVFTLVVTNSGPDAANNVSVMDRLPTGYLYLRDDSLAKGYTYSAGSGLWTIGTIGAAAPSNTAVLHVTAIVAAGGNYTNSAEVWSSDSLDPDSAPHNYLPGEDDYSSVTPVVQPKADLGIDKKLALKDDLDGNGILSVGDRVKFTLTVKNQGPNDAPSVTVNDVLPAGYTFVSANPSVGTYNSTSGVWSLGTLATLGSATLEIVGTVVGGKSADAYSNSAHVSSTAFDPDPSNDTDDVRPPVADLSLTKTVAFADGGDVDGDGTPSAGDLLVFTVTVHNAGPDFASGVEVLDQLPSGFAYDSDDASGDYDATTGVWAVGAIAPGASRALDVVVVVNASGVYANTAQVSKTRQFDPDSKPGNSVSSEDDQASVTVVPGAAPAAPTAKNDQSLGNPAGAVTLNITDNDTDPNLDLDPSTVDLDPSTPGQQTTRTVSGEGVWAVDAEGNVTFTPTAGFTKDPTPINYTVSDSGGRVSNQATITIDFVPEAADDASSGNTPGTAVTIDVLANDTTGDTVDPTTVKIVGTNRPGDPLVVPGEGTWTVDPTTGAITFTPEAGFTGDPTPITYTVKDHEGNVSAPANVTIDYAQRPPVAANNSSLANPPGSVTLNVTGNDSDPDGDLDPSTVDLDPSTPGRQTFLVVAGEGLWQVDDAGNVTFSPEPGFTVDPSPITYTVSDLAGLVSNVATIRVGYIPVAVDDWSKGNVPGSSVTLNVLGNDQGGDDPVPSTVKIVGTTNPGDPQVVPDEGTWTVNAVTGAITFTPLATFSGNPTPIQYTVKDQQGNPSYPATVTVEYGKAPDLSITKSDGVTSVGVNQTVTYTLSYANAGSIDATGVTITDTLPAGLGFNPASNPGWSLSGTTLTYTVGTVAAGATGTVSLVLVANASFAAGQTTITNTGTIADDGANGADPTPGNNSSTDTDQLNAAPDLTIDKSSVVTTVQAGQSVTYVITFRNNGTQGATGVVITDTIPTGMSFNAADNPGVTWSQSGSTLTYTVGSLAAGGSGTVTLVLKADATFPAGKTTIANTALIADDGTNGPDLNPSNNGDTETDTLIATPDLSLVKSNGVSTITPNQTVTYTLAYANNGTQGATGVVITDTLPTGLSFSPASNPGWSLSGSTLTYTVGGVAAGASGTVSLVLVADATFPAGTTTITNTGAIDDDHNNGDDPTPLDNTSDDTDSVDAAPDLSIRKSNGVSKITANQVVTYTLTYANNGTQGATGVVITDTLPAGLSFDPASNPGWTLGIDGITLTYTVGPVAAGAGGFVSLVLVANDSFSASQHSIVNTAAIADDGSNGTDPDQSNNSSTDTDTIDAVIDMVITKGNGISSIVPGQSVTYTLSYTNAGTAGATTVVITDALPTGMRFDGADPANGGWSLGGDGVTLTYTVGAVDAGARGSVSLVLVAKAKFAAGQTTITNTATIASDGIDETPDNNSSTDTDQLNAAPDLWIDKSSPVTTVSAGQSVTYTIAYANDGTQDATGVVITDTIPTGMSFNAADNPGVTWSQSGSTLTYAVGSLAAGGRGTVMLVLKANATFAAGQATIANTALIADDGTNGPDPTPSNNGDTETDELIATPDLSIVKSNGVSVITPNQTVTYTLAYANNGTQGATGVVITDTLPAGLNFNPVLNPGWAVDEDGVTLTYAVGSVAAGATGSVNIVLVADAAFSAGQASITNTASVADDEANGTDPDLTDNSDDETDPLDAAPDLTIAKTSSITTVRAGDSVTYVLAYANNGTRGATGVVITDTLPTGMGFDDTDPANEGWSLDEDGVTLTYTVGAVAAGDSGTVALVLIADARFVAGQTTITNTGTVDDDHTNGTDPDRSNNSSAETDTLDATPDLSITKSSSVVRIAPEDSVTYVVAYANKGTQNATGVVITDTLPVGMGFNAADNPGWSVGDDGVTLTYAVGNVAAGASGFVNLVLVANATFPAGQTSITNTASVSDDGTNGIDPTPGDNSDGETDALDGAPDLTLVKSSVATSIKAGDSVTYVLAYSNVGTFGATGVVITDTLPTGMGFDETDPANEGWSLDVDGVTLIYTVGSVAVGAGGSVNLVLVANATFAAGQASITNTGVIDDDHANGTDPDPSNNRSTETDTLDAAPDLKVVKSSTVTSVKAGDLVTYTFAYSNIGTQGATGVKISDTIPTGMTFNAADNTGVTWTQVGSTLTYTVGSLAAGGGNSVALKLRANATFAAGQASIANTGLIDDDHANGTDPDPSNNRSTETDTLDAAPDLKVVKSSTVTSIKAGDLVTYTFAYSNIGTQGATGVKISDTIPTGMTFNAADNTGVTWTQVGSTLTYTVGSLAAGGGNSVTLKLRANATFAAGQASIVNTGSVADDKANGDDPTPLNNTDTETDTLDATPDLTISITDGISTITSGQTVTYAIAYNNVGTQGATGVVVSLPLPAGMTFNAAANPGWSLSGSTLTRTIGSLAAGGSGSTNLVLIAASSFASGQSSVTATATIRDDGGNGSDPTPANNIASDTDGLPFIVAGTDSSCDKSPYVYVLDPVTGAVRTQFLAYEATFRGGVRVSLGDVDGDGVEEIVTAPGSGRIGEIRVFRQDGSELVQYRTLPFDRSYRSGVEVATGDVDGDGDDDIVAAGSRGPGDVAVFRVDVGAADPVANTPIKQFRAFSSTYLGGASVATADFGRLSGGVFNRSAPDGRVEIVVGSGPGMAPVVKVFDISGSPRVVDTLNPFGHLAGFRNGVTVSTGRYDGDTTPDIMVAGGRGAGSQVEVYSGSPATTPRLLSRMAAFAGLARANAAVYAAGLDLDGDGRIDRLYAGQGDGGAGTGVRSLAPSGSVASTFSSLARNVRVATSRPWQLPPR